MPSDVFWAAFGGGAAAGIFTLLAVLSTEWFRDFLNRPRIGTKLMFAQIISHAHANRDSTQYLSFEAANAKDKPVTLSSYGLMFKRRKSDLLHVIPSPVTTFPIRLESRDSISDHIPQENLFKTLREMHKRPKELKWVYFKDATGYYYRNKIAKITIKELERRYNEYLTETRQN
jgi:hypothetical protein